MSGLTIAQVRSWAPASWTPAATAVGEASTMVDEQARSLSGTLEQALTGARGYWAMAASERAAEEARTGARLADALDLARAALRTGATDIGHARTQLLDTIAGAEAEGFTVGDDGSVTAPTLPPVLTSPENAAAAAADRDAERVGRRPAGALAGDIGAASPGSTPPTRRPVKRWAGSTSRRPWSPRSRPTSSGRSPAGTCSAPSAPPAARSPSVWS